MKYSGLTQFSTKYSLSVKIKVCVYFLFSLFFSFLIPDNLYAQNPTVTFTAGAYIIDMGTDTSNVSIANGLKPYGLVYDLIVNNSVPVSWAIDDTKSKDGIDFMANGRPFRGGSFIIASEYINPNVSNVISTWESKGVVVKYITSDFTAPVFHQLSSWPRAILDSLHTDIVKRYYENAEIDSASYITAGNPTMISSCEDVYILPHPEILPTPDEIGWPQSYIDALKSFIINDKGNLWAGCKAPSQLESFVGFNFLSDNGLLPAGSRFMNLEENIPYDYNPKEDNNPIMQFIGPLDKATNKGSEVIYIPKTDWSSTTSKAVYDQDHDTYKELATIVAYGRAFGNSDNGMVMYEAGHDLDDNRWGKEGYKGDDPYYLVPESAKVAAQRAFFNFILLTGIEKEIESEISGPDNIISGETKTYNGSASGGTPPYEFEWTSNSGGTFTNQNSPDGVYTAPCGVSQDVITLKVTDACGDLVGRFSFETKLIQIIQTEAPSGAAEQTFCKGATVASLEPNGTDIKWYDVATGGDPLDETVILVDQYYYASQTLNGCESPERLAVRVYINYQ